MKSLFRLVLASLVILTVSIGSAWFSECPNCHKPVSPDFLYCPACGISLAHYSRDLMIDKLLESAKYQKAPERST